MFNILPVRKLIKVVSSKRGVAIAKPKVTERDRVPTSLTEDLDKNVAERNYWLIFCFIFILLLLIWFIHLLGFYYMTYELYIPVFKSSEEANRSTALNGSDEKLPICFVDVFSFGNISINENVTEISETEHTDVQRGGYYAPDKCWSRHKVAVLVPYRNRKEHLATFLFNIHPFLMNQKLEYRIFIIEQKGTAPFNRGRLFNAGFKEVKKFGSWKCVVLHDVDLLPVNARVMYSCPIWPRHMCATITGFENPSFYKSFGGVSIITLEHYEKINGFSNQYWGWGGEDTDLFRRIRTHGLPVASYSRKIAIYRSLNHSKQIENLLRFDLLKTATDRCYHEGLSNLRYAVESVTLHHLYTHILVDINPFNERMQYLTE